MYNKLDISLYGTKLLKERYGIVCDMVWESWLARDMERYKEYKQEVQLLKNELKIRTKRRPSKTVRNARLYLR